MLLFNGLKKDAPLSLAPRQGAQYSRVISELLDLDHDAWKIQLNGHRSTFYRETGGKGSVLPFGAIAITSAPYKPQKMTFHCAAGTHSILEAYRDDLPEMVDTLLSRERAISLFNGLARTIHSTHWEHNLGFAGTLVTKREIRLRSDAPLFQKLVESLPPLATLPLLGASKPHPERAPAGIVVEQLEGAAPVMRCTLNYPREISLTFQSARLWKGLRAVTDTLVNLVVEHNRELAERLDPQDPWE
jgi:hypothetical protein